MPAYEIFKQGRVLLRSILFVRFYGFFFTDNDIFMYWEKVLLLVAVVALEYA